MISVGEVVKNKLKEVGMSRKELAQRTNVTEKHICTIINGDKGISVAFARKLGYVFDDIDWLKLQTEYENEQLRIKEANSVSSDEIEILKPLHEIMSYFIEKGFMHNDCGDVSKVIQLREFLKISDLTLIPNITYNAAYRAQLSSNVKVDPYVLFAWQRLCEEETKEIEMRNSLDVALLKKNIPEMKLMMFGDINQGISSLQNLFSECGIAFQVVKNFRGAPVQGFIKETAEQRLILCLTIRRQRADIFWFTLFHEIAHVLNNDYSKRFVDFDSLQSDIESKADKFASDTLIDSELYREFLRSSSYASWEQIEEFARKVNVQPFIVLGRLQNDKILDWSDYSNKVMKYSWA